MKKKSMGFGVIISLVMLCMMGCNKSDNSSNDKRIDTKSILFGSEITESNNPDEDAAEYFILKKVIRSEGVHISYPEIENLNNGIESQWNSIFLNIVQEMIKNKEKDCELELTYEVKTCSKDLLSIVLIGTLDVSEGSSEKYNIIKSFNINMNTGQNIRLSNNESYDIEKIAYNIFNGTSYDICSDEVSKDDVKNYIDVFYEDSKELEDTLAELDYIDSTTYTTGYSYYEGGNLYICLEVNHSLGDYVILRIED
ncbi:MAG: hypothetical protein K6G26_10340 [Lachnospiraceae bacterium]|nr:hypothetical protein [Lachnospiraceae bacterium]